MFAQSLYVARHDRLRHGRGLGLTRNGSDALAPLFRPDKERLLFWTEDREGRPCDRRRVNLLVGIFGSRGRASKRVPERKRRMII